MKLKIKDQLKYLIGNIIRTLKYGFITMSDYYLRVSLKFLTDN